MFEKIKRNFVTAKLQEEQLYEKVMSELEANQRRIGLWGKALANSDGNDERAKALYIQYRVQSLNDEVEISVKKVNKVENEVHVNSNVESNYLWVHLLVMLIGGFALFLFIMQK